MGRELPSSQRCRSRGMIQCLELITGIFANTPSIQMMALAGTIGTGLFLGSGRALANAGPAGIFMGYTIMGLLISVTLSIGELNATFLQRRCHSTRCLFRGSSIFFAQGWYVIYEYLISIPAEISAASAIIQFWVKLSSYLTLTSSYLPVCTLDTSCGSELTLYLWMSRLLSDSCRLRRSDPDPAKEPKSK